MMAIVPRFPVVVRDRQPAMPQVNSGKFPERLSRQNLKMRVAR